MKKPAKRIIGGSPLTFGEGNIKGRIKNVLNFKKPGSWVLIISVLAVILSSVGLLTNPALKLEETNAAIDKIYNDGIDQWNSNGVGIDPKVDLLFIRLLVTTVAQLN